MKYLNEHQCLDCIARHPDKIVGVKVRLVAQIANNGKHEEEAYRYAVSVSLDYYIVCFPPEMAFCLDDAKQLTAMAQIHLVTLT